MLAALSAAAVLGASPLTAVGARSADASPRVELSAAHLDEAPRGVDVRAGVATSALVASSGVQRRPAVFHRLPRTPAHAWLRSATSSGTAEPVSVLSVPGGTAVLGGRGTHVSPSCTGTDDGNRVQVLFAREAGTASRYAELQPSLSSFVADVDDTFALSSPTSGRRVRWVQDASCAPVIPEVVVPNGTLVGNAGLTSLATALQNAGYNRPDRKYLTFADAASLCGVGQMYRDDRASNDNVNNGGRPMYARVDTPCWAPHADYHSTPAHELMHMLGGVQSSAPHATADGHCTDESDAMCYDDGSGATVTATCTAAGAEAQFDCNRDDYFDSRPSPTGYLAAAWNTARSSFLDVLPDGGATSTPTASTTTTTTTTASPGPVDVTATSSAPATLYVGTGGLISATVASSVGAVATGVTLQSWTAATGWRSVASGQTSTAGTVSFTLRATTAQTVTTRVLVPATAVVGSATSNVTTTRIVRRPTGTLATVRLGRPDALTATVRTNLRVAVPGQYVTLQVKYPGSATWRTVARKLTNRSGQTVFTVQPQRRAYYRWVYAGSWNLAPSTSATSTVTY